MNCNEGSQTKVSSISQISRQRVERVQSGKCPLAAQPSAQFLFLATRGNRQGEQSLKTKGQGRQSEEFRSLISHEQMQGDLLYRPKLPSN